MDRLLTATTAARLARRSIFIDPFSLPAVLPFFCPARDSLSASTMESRQNAFASTGIQPSLKGDLCRNLSNTRIARTRNSTEITAGNIPRRVGEVRMVEHIEELGTQQQRDAFLDCAVDDSNGITVCVRHVNLVGGLVHNQHIGTVLTLNCPDHLLYFPINHPAL